MTVSNSRNSSRVYIRLCKQGKRFLLLKSRLCLVLNTVKKLHPLYREILELHIRKYYHNAAMNINVRRGSK